ncbi:ankyrin repeat-containing protein BDA1-like [Mercurialis annua]|uniref:ankyrin repeat-containing protein BDA1-like n=1 Tax=Mercurialis annua TaxID=3986 RepID=UPI002160D292|nr:ankyrin repeat-containing protein BDA1-like [Mercurialis annua]
MNQQLVNASREGDIDTLYSLIRKDPCLLEHVDAIPYVNSPLHVAASSGRIEFATEIMRLKPSLSRKLNGDGFSPIHLALQNRHTQVVLGLLEIDGELVCVKGREGITPLHYAASLGNMELLPKFLSVCPKSIQDLTVRNETALHIALRNNRSEAFEFLLKWVCHARVLNQQDVEGNTLLHIATIRNHTHFVRLLLIT